jgi:hypothetical protein
MDSQSREKRDHHPLITETGQPPGATTSEELAMTIATTILEHLGGNRFIAMTGAKHLVDHGNALSFKFPKPKGQKVNYLKIELETFDTYSLTFGYLRGLSATLETPKTVVYAAQLQALFTERTGLDTHL